MDKMSEDLITIANDIAEKKELRSFFFNLTLYKNKLL